MIEQLIEPVCVTYHSLRAKQQHILAKSQARREVTNSGIVGRTGVTQHAQHFRPQLRHGVQPVEHRRVIGTTVDNQNFVFRVCRAFYQAFDATLQGVQRLAGLNDDRHQRTREAVVVDAIDQRQGLLPDRMRHTDAVQVRTHHAGVIFNQVGLRQPVCKGQARLHLNFGNMLDGLRPGLFDHPPHQVMRRQLTVCAIETAQRHETLALEGQGAADIGVGAHEVEVEIGFEHRVDRFTLDQRTFVAVDATDSGRMSDAFGKNKQCRFTHYVTGLQQVKPVRTFQLRDQRIELLRPV